MLRTEPTLILLVDDNLGDARLLKELLRETEAPFAMIHAQTLAEAIERLESERFDVMFLDLSLPDASGLETVERACAADNGTPIIVLTGTDDETLGLKAVQAGAQDYLVKGEVEGAALWRTIRYAMERHRMMRELERSQREQLEMKDQFLSHLSHELRSPLTTVYQFLSILTDGLAGDLNAEQREYLEIVERNVHQLRSMINDLLDVTRVGNGKLTVSPQCASIVSILSETVQSLQASAAEKGVRLLQEDMPWSPPVLADPDRVRQILTNLVENAIKFTPDGGSVSLRAAAPVHESSFVCVSVSDTGIGISEEGVTRIFNRLYQEPNSIETSRKGLGIGLYIARELVSRHGGQIWVESKIGVGSTFTFTLPCAAPEDIVRPMYRDMTARDFTIVRAIVTPAHSGGALSETARRHTLNLIGGLMEYGRDYVLPRTSSTSDREQIFVLSSGSESEVMDLVETCSMLSCARQDLIDMGVQIEADAVPLYSRRRCDGESDCAVEVDAMDCIATLASHVRVEAGARR